jgi:hypothetical protein
MEAQFGRSQPDSQINDSMDRRYAKVDGGMQIVSLMVPKSMYPDKSNEHGQIATFDSRKLKKTIFQSQTSNNYYDNSIKHESNNEDMVPRLSPIKLTSLFEDFRPEPTPERIPKAETKQMVLSPTSI